MAPSDVFVEHLYEPTVSKKEITKANQVTEVSIIDTGWRVPFIKFLTQQKLSQDKNEAERVTRRSKL